MAENKNSNDEKILYILRGLPGSGKSSLAKTIINSHGKRGVVLSADDYFLVNGKYEYDPTKIGEAHLFNQESCREKCEQGVSPIIIDNTNVKCWEAKVYVEIALNYGYKIKVREPETPWWKNRDPEKLARKTLHGVPLKKIKGMLDRWDDDFSVEAILNSEPPNRNVHQSNTSYNNNNNYNKYSNYNNRFNNYNNNGKNNNNKFNSSLHGNSNNRGNGRNNDQCKSNYNNNNNSNGRAINHHRGYGYGK